MSILWALEIAWIVPCLILQFMSGINSSAYFGYGALVQAGLVIICACVERAFNWPGLILALWFAWEWWRRRKDKRRARQLIGNKVRAVKARMARELADRSIPVPSRG